MIGRLTGEVLSVDDDGLMLIDVGGVGYEVLAPMATLEKLRGLGHGSSLPGKAAENAGSSGSRYTLFIHTHVREDAFLLYGFATDQDRVAFRALISVNNVGPKTAIHILSALPGADLAEAIFKKELSKLMSISGVGKKTAERLLLELQGKLPFHPTESRSTPHHLNLKKKSAKHSSSNSLLHQALVRMGYRPVEADMASERLAKQIEEGQELSILVKDALKLLSRK